MIPAAPIWVVYITALAAVGESHDVESEIANVSRPIGVLAQASTNLDALARNQERKKSSFFLPWAGVAVLLLTQILEGPPSSISKPIFTRKG